MRNSSVKQVALCGLLVAVAVIIMCLGGLIPLSTYVCPILCALICNIIILICGRRLAWTWYIAASVLILLLGTDKEASVLFVFIGSYPCVKVYIDRLPFKVFWKVLYLNFITVVATFITAYILGFPDLSYEFAQFGIVGILVVIVLANLTFYLLDKLLNRINDLFRKKKHNK